MDKNLDYEIYSEIDLDLELDNAPMHQRKAIHSRIVKLSSDKSRFSYARLGLALAESGQFSKSIIPLKRFTSIGPDNSKAQIRLINALSKLERVNEGLDCLKKFLLSCPEAGELHRVLIDMLEENNRLEELESFLKEIANTIKNPTSRQEFYILNAEILILCNQFPQALISYKKAIENNPIMEDYYHSNYGLALYHEGQFEEAIVQFEHAWRLNPAEKITFNNIVHLNYCLGRFEKALEGFEETIKNGLEVHYTYSNHILLLYHLDKDEGMINKYKGLLQSYIQSHRDALLRIYQEELRITETLLEKDDLDEKTKELHRKKLNGINLILSFL